MNVKLVINAILLFICTISAFAQSNSNGPYSKFIDSAYSRINDFHREAGLYLDSIPMPLNESIKGRLSSYYELRAMINGKKNEQALCHQNYLLALKYAKLEKNYVVAGSTNLELFSYEYSVKKDTSAFKYLRQAEHYYTLAGKEGFLLDVLQRYAYAKLVDDEFEESNKLIFKNLERYRAFKEDGFYYMYALFMLTSNYLHSDDWSSAQKYFRKFVETEKDTTVSKSLIKAFKSSLYNCMAESQLKLKQPDSALVYLAKAGKLKSYMNVDNVKVHYQFHIDTYKLKGDIENSNIYIDSLKQFQSNLLEKNIEASLKINEALVDTENQLSAETKKRETNRMLFIALISILILAGLFIFFRYKKMKQNLVKFVKRDKEFTFMQTSQEKLKIRVQGLESYMGDVKKEVKNISTTNDMEDQKNQIIKLYKTMHLNASTLLDKSLNRLEIINELNVAFFNKINTKHPQLKHSEVIICYYIHTGFKNKEIAAFLNTTEKAIESKRYRIRKKLSFQESDTKLVDYLHNI